MKATKKNKGHHQELGGLQEPGKSSGDHWRDLFQEAFPATAGFIYSAIQTPYVFMSHAVEAKPWLESYNLLELS